MSPRRSPLAEQELEIMKVVWDLENATVRDVYETLRKRRKVAYTTVMTMMNILAEKKLLKRAPQGRAFVYKAARPKKELVKAMVRDFVGRVFDGSARPLLVQLVEDEQLTEQDLKQIRDIIRKGS
jgi:predicted transcriptional regulator